MIQFFIDPSAAKEAVLNGKWLMVEVYGPKYYRVLVVPRNDPITPSDEAQGTAA